MDDDRSEGLSADEGRQAPQMHAGKKSYKKKQQERSRSRSSE